MHCGQQIWSRLVSGDLNLEYLESDSMKTRASLFPSPYNIFHVCLGAMPHPSP